MQEILTALGLSAPAGLNAPLVLLMTGLAAKFTGLIDLPDDYSWMESWGTLGGLSVWLAAEEVVDKVPGLDHVNDVVNSALRPAAGAVLSLALTEGDLSPVVGGALGLVLAGTTHAAKAGARPLVTAGSAGMGNPVVSTIEDVVAFLAAAIALLAPILVIGVLAALAYALWRIVRALRRRGARRAPSPT